MTATSLNQYLKNFNSTLPVPKELHEIMRQIVQLHEANGGATYNLYFGDQSETRLYSVSIFPERSIILTGKEIDAEILVDFIADNADLLEDARCCIGTWYDEAANETYLDISVTLLRKRDTLYLGQQYNQVGIFDLYRMEYSPTGRTGRIPENARPENARLPQMRRERTNYENDPGSDTG